MNEKANRPGVDRADAGRLHRTARRADDNVIIPHAAPVTCAWRVTYPNGTTQLVEARCPTCLPEVVEIPRRRASCLIIWRCTAGCGWIPAEHGGGPVEEVVS